MRRPLVFCLSLAAVLVGTATRSARADLSISIGSVSIAAGGTGSVNVMISGAGESLNVTGFQFLITPNSPTTTQLAFVNPQSDSALSNPNYVFAGHQRRFQLTSARRQRDHDQLHERHLHRRRQLRPVNRLGDGHKLGPTGHARPVNENRHAPLGRRFLLDLVAGEQLHPVSRSFPGFNPFHFNPRHGDDHQGRPRTGVDGDPRFRLPAPRRLPTTRFAATSPSDTDSRRPRRLTIRSVNRQSSLEVPRW